LVNVAAVLLMHLSIFLLCMIFHRVICEQHKTFPLPTFVQGETEELAYLFRLDQTLVPGGRALLSRNVRLHMATCSAQCC